MKRVWTTTIAMLFVASIASAQHPEHGGPGGPGFGGPEGHAIVGSDGTIYIESVTVDTTNRTSSTKVTAVRTTGTIAWTATVANAHGFELSGTNLITANSTTASDGTVSTTLTALSANSGAVAWTRTLAGRAGELRPFSGGTYVFVVVPPASSGGTATRSLVAIGNDGSVLWTLSLT